MLRTIGEKLKPPKFSPSEFACMDCVVVILCNFWRVGQSEKNFFFYLIGEGKVKTLPLEKRHRTPPSQTGVIVC